VKRIIRNQLDKSFHIDSLIDVLPTM